MNNYIKLGTKQYVTPSPNWEPTNITPREVRVLQDGTLDATFANVTILEWRGEVEAPVTPENASWGSVSDLRTILATKGSVAFEDHYGNAYTAYISEIGSEFSASPMWDGASNTINFPVVIMAEDTP